MIKYYDEREIEISKKQYKRNLLILLSITFLFIALILALFVINYNLPYNASIKTLYKIIGIVSILIYVIFAIIFIGIKLVRVKCYYTHCENVKDGLKETTTAVFLRFNNEIQVKDGVDFKQMIFSEWNKFKSEFYDRKVLVYAEKDYPNIEIGSTVTFVTQGNVLVEYEIEEIKE